MALRLILCFSVCFFIPSCSTTAQGKINAGKIESSVQKGEDVNYEDCTVSDDLNFIDLDAAVMVVPAQYNVCVKSALVFKNCTFKGMVIASVADKNSKNSYSTTFFKNLYFENCTFLDDVNMEGATINGYCNFLNCTFKKDALFNRVIFNGTVAFTKCNFEQSAGFQSCTFVNDAFFNNAHFSQACFFQNSFCYREFTFNLVNAEGYTDFTTTNFYSNLHFNYAQFHKDLVFSNSNFKGRTEFIGSKFLQAEFDGSVFYGLTIFDKSTFDETFSLKNSKFLLGKPQANSYKAGKTDFTGAEISGFQKMPDL